MNRLIQPEYDFSRDTYVAATVSSKPVEFHVYTQQEMEWGTGFVVPCMSMEMRELILLENNWVLLPVTLMMN